MPTWLGRLTIDATVGRLLALNGVVFPLLIDWSQTLTGWTEFSVAVGIKCDWRRSRGSANKFPDFTVLLEDEGGAQKAPIGLEDFKTALNAGAVVRVQEKIAECDDCGLERRLPLG